MDASIILELAQCFRCCGSKFIGVLQNRKESLLFCTGVPVNPEARHAKNENVSNASCRSVTMHNFGTIKNVASITFTRSCLNNVAARL
jgi:hypothetical protein